jgi:hypothetical protein
MILKMPNMIRIIQKVKLLLIGNGYRVLILAACCLEIYMVEVICGGAQSTSTGSFLARI